MRSFSSAARCGIAFLLLLGAVLIAPGAVAQPAGQQPTDTASDAPADAPGDAPADAEAAPPAEGSADPAAQTGAPTDVATTGAPADGSVPVNIRLRRLEQRVQALKERAWRAKARVGMLKEAVLGGGIGARASITHKNEMGNSYRLVKLVYALDGTQIFARNDPSGALHENQSFDVLTGPIAPGSHTISVLAVYRGNGYGVFKYLNEYKFTVRSSHTFTASEGKGTSVTVLAFERGGVTTPLEQRPAIDFKVSHSGGLGK